MSARLTHAAMVAVALFCAAEAQAQSAVGYLGTAWFGSNDSFGDGDDRWRSASLGLDILFGPRDATEPPERLGQLLDFRLGGEVISPASLSAPLPDDRAYATYLSFGLHTLARRGATDYRLGADIVVIGPQTGLGDLQREIHSRIDGQPDPTNAQKTQIGNTARLAVSGEAARTMTFGNGARLRPYLEARTGDETFVRIGADLIVGGFGRGVPVLRDTVTGHLYEGIKSDSRGFSWIIGADVAGISDSVYLPESRTARMEPLRGRVRAGLHWQRDRITVQYGLTWLSPEFEQQPEGQLLGGATIRFSF